MIALIVYLFFGVALAWALLPSLRGPVKCWLGLVFGCVALMWLPCLPAFFLGFTMAAQLIAFIAAAVGGAALCVRIFWRARTGERRKPARPSRNDTVGLMVTGFVTVFCAYLLHTHVLLAMEDGSLWVGQSTYGDLGMHLGFAESLYRQGTFPPEYSIYPGQTLNYPFLVDAASASLRFFGLSLRLAVIVPGVLMIFCVFWGFWLLAEKLTRKLAPTLMSWLLLVFNGGFGFVYFLGKYDFSEIFTGFYTTPTNLVQEDIRWVNVICDMLIPQRTTMAGWCVILAAIYLLITALEKVMAGGGGRRETLVLASLAGTMPMIHTHSFLALGILSAAWFFALLPRARRTGRLRALVLRYVLYGAVCLAMALPQMLYWTMDSVRSGNLLQWNLGWVVGQNGALKSWVLFYIVNCGVVFLAMWPMIPFLRGEENAQKRMIFTGAAAIFLLSNVVAFQPNLYDNNKLLYIWFMLTDILVCDWLWGYIERARYRPLRSAMGAVIVLMGTLSGALTMLREAVSGYQLLSPAQVAAAEYILDNTEPDSLFLTATNHTNPVSVLTGRNIVCGSSLYLYYHGVDYQQREAMLPEMYAGGEVFEREAEALGIDYVYISDYERASYDVNTDWFRERFPLVYDEGGISIFATERSTS